jgi:hypothetical protein
MIAYCHACGGELDLFVKVSRNDRCDHCAADLHCCKNCVFYEPGANNDCREVLTAPVADREKANFCTSYVMSQKKPEKSVDKAAVKSKLDALFNFKKK